MTRLLIALFAAVIAATTLEAPPASAGVRIGFGIPLGALMATPSRGPSYNRGHRRSQAAGSYYKKKKALAAARASGRASQRAKLAHAQRQRAIARAQARAEAKAAAAKAAARSNVAKADDKADDKVEEKTEKSEKTATTTSTTGTPEPKPLAPAPITPPGGPVTTTVEPEIVQTTATMSVPDQPAESATEAEPAPSKKADCKKFVPSVGLTITVPCN